MRTAAAHRGTTTVADKAVRRVAARAAVEALPARGSVAVAAKVQGHTVRLRADVALRAPTVGSLAGVVRGLQEHLVSRTGQLTGLDVARPLVRVVRFRLPTADVGSPRLPTQASVGTTPARTAPREPVPRTPRRWWSARRVPAMTVASSTGLAAGCLAAEVLRTRLTGEPPAPWRTGVAQWLSAQGPVGPQATAAVVAAVGLVLIGLAVLPGRRRLATVRSEPRLLAAVDRDVLESLIHDAVAATEGVVTVRVRGRRRRVTVRAAIRGGDLGVASEDVERAARRALDTCRLRCQPRLRVTVRPLAPADARRAPRIDDRSHLPAVREGARS
ncbi:DUF6286 domain-containing protein [Streptomyces sp. NPDC055055]